MAVVSLCVHGHDGAARWGNFAGFVSSMISRVVVREASNYSCSLDRNIRLHIVIITFLEKVFISLLARSPGATDHCDYLPRSTKLGR